MSILATLDHARSLTTRANVSPGVNRPPRRPFLPVAEWCGYPFDEPAYRFITPIDYRRYSINMFMLVFAGCDVAPAGGE